MTKFEITIKAIKEINRTSNFHSNISIVEYAELIEKACNEFGREKVMSALN